MNLTQSGQIQEDRKQGGGLQGLGEWQWRVVCLMVIEFQFYEAKKKKNLDLGCIPCECTEH